jgi:hypothetical protein
MKNIREKLVDFRNTLYHLYPKRKDAIFELMDANSASTTSLNSAVHLGKSAFFTRQYPSITDALTDGLAVAQWDDIQKLMWRTSQPKDMASYHRFIADCTPQDRLHAKTLDDRFIDHKANPAPGNKPICAGHEYSTVVYVPPEAQKSVNAGLFLYQQKESPAKKKGMSWE